MVAAAAFAPHTCELLRLTAADCNIGAQMFADGDECQ
jgi:hypothetical protein